MKPAPLVPTRPEERANRLRRKFTRLRNRIGGHPGLGRFAYYARRPIVRLDELATGLTQADLDRPALLGSRLLGKLRAVIVIGHFGRGYRAMATPMMPRQGATRVERMLRPRPR
jgi:hypothetical protein